MGYIYKITNKFNNKSYIGQTIQTILKRYANHLYCATLEKSKNYNIELYKDMREYGIENFNISKLEECDNNMLDERETYWIKYYNTKENGYNSSYGGKGRKLYQDDKILELWNKGFTINNISESKETAIKNKKQIRNILQINGITKEEIKKRNNKNRLCKGNIVKIYQYSLNGKYIQEFSCIAEANRYMGKNSQANCIYECSNFKQKTAYGYYWRKYKTDILNDIPIYKRKSKLIKEVS